MKILKFIWFVILFVCIFIMPALGSNIQINQMQDQKKTIILNLLEKEDLILPEIKKLGNKKDEVLCLALNMYHEARGSNLKDQIATSYVVLNRLNDKNFPLFYPKSNKSICNIVFDRYQFCWTNGDKVSKPKEIKVWNNIQNIAYQIYTNPVHQELAKKFKNKHYVATYMMKDKNKPKWINKRTQTTVIGKHSYLILDDKNVKNSSYYSSVIDYATTLLNK